MAQGAKETEMSAAMTFTLVIAVMFALAIVAIVDPKRPKY